jgi:hypothetical protein
MSGLKKKQQKHYTKYEEGVAGFGQTASRGVSGETNVVDAGTLGANIPGTLAFV